MKRLLTILGFACWLCISPAFGGLVDTNGTFRVRGRNFPVDFALTTVPLDGGTYPLAGNLLNVRAEKFVLDADSEWIQFDFSTPTGNAIAGNLNAFWDFEITDISYTGPVLWQAFMYYWTIDGNAVPNIKAWAGGVLFPPDGTNPIDPTLGKAFGGREDDPFPPFDPRIFISPFSLISTSQVGDALDPSTVNGFRVAALVVRASNNPIPEPSTVCVWAVFGLVGAGAFYRRKCHAHKK